MSDASTPTLLAAVINDARELAIGHLQRMQGEIGDEFRNLKLAMARIAIAVAVVIVGAVLVGHAIATGIMALGLAAWASYGITAVVAVVTGVVLLKRMPAEKKDMDLVPEEALASLRRDYERIKDAATP